MKTLDKIVEDEMQRLKPQMTSGEWFALVEVLRQSLTRVDKAAFDLNDSREGMNG
ncbi:hypothetical protein UFOVP1196_37 [uncultured Caudovirales phage]|uniref:Uncharacterized protein n=1 Tax=uncultured Caudovirales phage TaxID=2100421 RepID=A0A6J5RCB0_9CAUD|nr:hypothetical protein UFOVP1196_37 [uncultured Caudovirales phage]